MAIKKMKSGRYQIDYRDQNGDRHRKSFDKPRYWFADGNLIPFPSGKRGYGNTNFLCQLDLCPVKFVADLA